ncbi:hypothetical protein STENM223S_06032 [Streptomyces tendae]
MLYAPYPAPPIITANTPPTTATLTPLPIGRPSPGRTPRSLNTFKSPARPEL